MSPPRDTIYALSSGRIPAAIAVVRISGPRAGDALKALAGRIPEPRRGAFARVRDPQTREPIDDALALWFPGPNSETGEDTAELQLHGGRAVLAATFAALGRLEGFRPAEAGEFTRRAFENGKIDLTTVEGLADLVAAETEGQRRQALRQMQGALRARAEGWRERLIKAQALVEAGIDFSDEGDVPEELTAPARSIARELETEIAAALRDAARGERLREGFVVAIAGPPNAGKSTLLNRLAQREAAIVSPYAGTTRDVIEVHLDLGGWPVTLLDTAGIRETADPVEMEGVRRARERAAAADLVLWVVDATQPLDESAAGLGAGLFGRAGEDGAVSRNGAHGQLRGVARAEGGAGADSLVPVWLVVNKADLLGPGSGVSCSAWEATPHSAGSTRHPSDSVQLPTGPTQPSAASAPRATGATEPLRPAELMNLEFLKSVKNEHKVRTIDDRFILSSQTGAGTDNLLVSLKETAAGALAALEPALVTRERQRLALEDARAALARLGAGALSDDLFAEELRLAARALERLIGRVDVEDVLQVIFRDFCIGK